MGKQEMDENDRSENIQQINNCDVNASCIETDSDSCCPFLKCKEKPIHLEAITSDDLPQGESVNTHDLLKRTTNNGGSDRIFAKQDVEGAWMLRWDVAQQKEGDFLALCYQGESFLL